MTSPTAIFIILGNRQLGKQDDLAMVDKSLGSLGCVIDPKETLSPRHRDSWGADKCW